MPRVNLAAAVLALSARRRTGFFRRDRRAVVRSARRLLDWFVEEIRLCLDGALVGEVFVDMPGASKAAMNGPAQNNCDLLTR